MDPIDIGYIESLQQCGMNVRSVNMTQEKKIKNSIKKAIAGIIVSVVGVTTLISQTLHSLIAVIIILAGLFLISVYSAENY